MTKKKNGEEKRVRVVRPEEKVKRKNMINIYS